MTPEEQIRRMDPGVKPGCECYHPEFGRLVTRGMTLTNEQIAAHKRIAPRLAENRARIAAMIAARDCTPNSAIRLKDKES